MVPSKMAGGTAQSSSSSGIFFQGNVESHVAGHSQLSSNFGNTNNTIHGHARANVGALSGDVSTAVLNSGASSLVTDANSGLSGGPHMQRSASINTESYMRLPASPLSFTSNNISISGSSVIEGSSVVQQSSNPDPGSQQSQQIQQPSSATSLPASRMGPIHLTGGPRGPNSFIQDPNAVSQMQKRPRVEIKQEDVLQQQALQQMLQRQDPQLHALLQQQRLRQQQQIIQSLPPMQRVQLMQQQQLRQQLLQPLSGVKRPYDGGVCSRRLMQYLYHQRQRPADDIISYWRQFVAEYYSPRAKKRWCLSLYDNVGQQSLGVFPQSAMDAWQCDLCGSKSGRGFEATFEVLARLNEIKFNSGVIDELLILGIPRECRFPSGMMMLEYAKAVQESVYEQLRVVREGQLRIIFTPDLKILSWEFCARRHEELLPRRLVAPQANQLLHAAEKCQSTVSGSGPDGISQSGLQAHNGMVLTAGRRLAMSLELQSLNDLGFSKRYVRCLQIAEVVNTMKDLMDFCRDQKVGAVEGLKNFPRHANTSKVQMTKMEEMEMGGGLHGVPADRNILNNLMGSHLGPNGPINNNQQPQPAALSLTNYQSFLMRQNSINSNHSSHNQHEASSPFSTSNQLPSTPSSSNILPGAVQSSPVGGFSGCQIPQQRPQGLLPQNQSLSSQNNQNLQQQILQQLLYDRSNTIGGPGVPQQPISVQNPGGSISRDGVGLRGPSSTTVSGNGPGSVAEKPPSRSNSFKSVSNNEPVRNVGFGQKAVSDSTQDLHLSEDMVQNFAHEFTESGFFNSDLDDSMNFSWRHD